MPEERLDFRRPFQKGNLWDIIQGTFVSQLCSQDNLPSAIADEIKNLNDDERIFVVPYYMVMFGVPSTSQLYAVYRTRGKDKR